MCSNIEQNKTISRKFHQDRYKKLQLDGFYWLSFDLLTQIIAHKSDEKARKNQHELNPHVAEVEGTGIETTFRDFIQTNKSEKEIIPLIGLKKFTKDKQP